MTSTQMLIDVLDPRGRCDRRGLLIAAVALLVLQAVVAIAAWQGLIARDGGLMHTIEVLVLVLAVSATSKRLHDIGLSAWWLLAGAGMLTVWSIVLAIVLVVLFGASAAQPGTAGFMLAILGTMAPAFAVTMWLHLAKGDIGANRFGPEPTGLGFSSRRGEQAGARMVLAAAPMRAQA